MTTKTKRKPKSVLAWHFLPEDRRLQYNDRREVNPGETLTVAAARLSLCNYGLHASKDARDAASFRRGPVVCRVRLSGRIIEGDDKCVASERTVLWMADASKTLRQYAIWCATRALKREEERKRKVDPRSWAALKAAQDYIDGKIGPKELEKARAAAYADAAADAYAAGAAVAAAAADAAAAAADAADAAADAYAAGAAVAAAAADAAAAVAADAAAYDAAWKREREAQSKQLTKMLMGLKP